MTEFVILTEAGFTFLVAGAVLGMTAFLMAIIITFVKRGK